MSRIVESLADHAEPMPTPSAAEPVRRKLGKLPPMTPGLHGSRCVTCSLCRRQVFSGLLLAHKQEAHGDTVYRRTASGRPKNLWFRCPVPVATPVWRRPAALRSIFTR